MTHATNRTMTCLFLALVACGGASLGIGTTASGGTAEPSSAAEPPPVGEPSGNWTLAEREFWTKLQEELDEFTKRANEHCHSQITASYDQESYRGKLTAGGSYGLPEFTRSVCTSGAINAIRDVCLDGDSAKKAVAASIHHVTCHWGKTGYVLGKGTFHATYNTADSDQLSYYLEPMTAYLRSHL